MTNILYIIFFPPLLISLIISFPLLFRLLFKKNDFVFFISGILIYTLIHIIYRNSKIISKLYIISHEISHAFAGIIKGNKIKKIKISSRAGYVSFSRKTDSVTAIFPYIFPLYNIALTLIYAIVYFIFKLSSHRLFFLLNGMAIMFYTLNTFQLIFTDQSDFVKFGGRFKSFLFITTINPLVTAIFIMMIFPDYAVSRMFFLKLSESYLNAVKIIFNYTAVFLKKLFDLCL